MAPKIDTRAAIIELETLDKIRRLLQDVRFRNQKTTKDIKLPLRLKHLNVSFFDSLLRCICDGIIDDPSALPNPSDAATVYFQSLTDFVSCVLNVQLDYIDATLLANHDANSLLSLVRVLVGISQRLCESEDVDQQPAPSSSKSKRSVDFAPKHLQEKLRGLGQRSLLITPRTRHKRLLAQKQRQRTILLPPQKTRGSSSKRTKVLPSTLAAATHHLEMMSRVADAHSKADEEENAMCSSSTELCPKLLAAPVRLERALGVRREGWELKRARLAVVNAKKSAQSRDIARAKRRQSLDRMAAAQHTRMALVEKQSADVVRDRWWTAAKEAERELASRMRSQKSAPITVIERIKRLQQRQKMLDRD